MLAIAWDRHIINMKSLMNFLDQLKKTLKDISILLLYLEHRLLSVFKTEKQLFLSTKEPQLQLTSLKTENKEVQSTTNTVSNNIISIKDKLDMTNIEHVNQFIILLNYQIRVLANKKSEAKTLTEFYNTNKLIVLKSEELSNAVETYIDLEREYGFPINLNYRSLNKSLKKNLKGRKK